MADDKAAIVQELYRRRDTLPEEKRAVVDELARRYGFAQQSGSYLSPEQVSARKSQIDSMYDRYAQQSQNQAPPVDVSWRGLLKGLLLDTGQGITQAATHPIDTAAALVNRQAQSLQDAKDAYSVGDYGSAQMHALAYLTPVFGPQAIDIGRKISSGNVSEGVGDAIALIGPEAAMKIPAVREATTPTAQAGPALRLPVLATNNPVAQSAIAFARRRGIPVDMATATGSKIAKFGQSVVEGNLGGFQYAEKAKETAVDALKETGSHLANQISSDIPGRSFEKEVAGRNVAATLENKAQEHLTEGNQQYSTLRDIEAQPQNTKTVQVGSKPVSTGVIGPDGQPIVREQPITETFQAPVDLASAQELLKPIFEKLMRAMPVAQQRASAGLKAIQNILESDRYMSASDADESLSALKEVQRDPLTAKNARLVNQAVSTLSDAVDKAVADMGPEAQKALSEGRAAVRTHYEVKDVADALRTEPVQLFNQLTQRGDTAIDLLRSVQEHAPDQMRQLGRSYFEGLMQEAQRSGGFDKARTILTKWENLGDKTKDILFGRQNAQDVNDFLQISQRMNEANPSGSGHIAHMTTQGLLLVTAPHVGVPYVISGAAMARLMFNPQAVRALTEGLTISLKSPARAAQVFNRISRATGDSLQPLKGAPVAMPVAADDDTNKRASN